MKDEHDPASEGERSGDTPGTPEKADELFEAARRRGRGLLDRQKEAAGVELHTVADAMRDCAHRLEEKEEAAVGRSVERVAEYMDRLSETLRSQDLEELLRRGERILRERPAVALGVTALAGFAIGRILRTATRRIADGRHEGQEA